MKIYYVLLLVLYVPVAFGVQKNISRIQVIGNKIISKKAVLEKIKTKKGRPLQSSIVTEDVKSLYQMGFFDHISVESKRVSGQLVVSFKVKERPTIHKISYKGNSALSDKKLKELSQFKLYEFLSISKIKKGIESIKKGYEEKGYFSAQVSYRLKPAEKPQHINVVVDIKEGAKALIKRVSFVGNKHISDDEIKPFLLSKEKNLLSWLTDSGVYKDENLKRDQQVIRLLYMEKGYMEVNVEEPSVSLSPSRDGIYISFTISEGQKFQVGQIEFKGDLIFSKLELRKALSLKTGDVFVFSRLQNDLKNIQTKYGSKGYAFAEVIPQFSNQEDTIHLLMNIQKGEMVHINHINIYGNHTTRDNVIRRELSIFEGELFDADKILKSTNAIKRMSYLESASIFNKPLKEGGKVDLEVSVKERENIGMFQAGGGYNFSQGVTFNTQFHKENIFGLGVTTGVQLILIPFLDTFLFNIQYTDPRLLDSNWYLNFNIYFEDTVFVRYVKKLGRCLVNDTRFSECIKNYSYKDIQKQSISRNFEDYRPYSAEKQGVQIALGRWFSDTVKVFYKTGIENVFLSSPDPEVNNHFHLSQARGRRGTLGGSLEYDNRDDRMFPTKGVLSSLSLDYIRKFRYENFSPQNLARVDASLGYYISLNRLFSLPFFPRTPRYVMFEELLRKFVLKNKFQYGRIGSFSQDKRVPVDLLYLLGGPHTLRGFGVYSVGGCHLNVCDYKGHKYGGNSQAFYNLEFQFPLMSQRRLFGLLFFDVGFADDNLFQGALIKTWNKMEKDVGFGFLFVTPMGPLNLKWGFPFKKSSWALALEEGPEFQFSVGTEF